MNRPRGLWVMFFLVILTTAFYTTFWLSEKRVKQTVTNAVKSVTERMSVTCSQFRSL